MAACMSHMLDIRRPDIYGMEKGDATATPLCNGASPPYVWAQQEATIQDCQTSDDFISVSSGGSLPHSPYSSPRSAASSSLRGSPSISILMEDESGYSIDHHRMMPSPFEPSPSPSPFRQEGTKGVLLGSFHGSANDVASGVGHHLSQPPKQQSCAAFKDDFHRATEKSPASFGSLLPSAASSTSRDDSAALQPIIDINGRSSRPSLLTTDFHISEALLSSPLHQGAAAAQATGTSLKATFCGHRRHPSLINTTEASEADPVALEFGLRRPLITTTAATDQQHQPDDDGIRLRLLSPSFPSARQESLPGRAMYSTRSRAACNGDAPSASSSFRSRRRVASTSLRSHQANEITTSSTTTTTTTTTTEQVHKSSTIAATFCSSASRFEPGVPPLPRPLPFASMTDDNSAAAAVAAAAIDLRHEQQTVTVNHNHRSSSRSGSSIRQEVPAAADMDAQMAIQQHQRPRNGGMMRSRASDQAIFSAGGSSACPLTHRMSLSESSSATPTGGAADPRSSGLRCNIASSSELQQQHCCRYRMNSCHSVFGLGEHQRRQLPISRGVIDRRCSIIADEDSSLKASPRPSAASAAAPSSVLRERDNGEQDGAMAAAPWTKCVDDGVSIDSSISSCDSCVIDRFLEVCRDTRVTAALATLDFKRRLPFLGPVLPRSASSGDATDGMLEAGAARPPSIKGTITALWALLAKTGMLQEECSVTAVFTALWILESFNDNRRRKATTVLRDYLECTPTKGGGRSSSSRGHGPGDGGSSRRQDGGSAFSSPPEFIAARPSDLAVEMLREPMVKTQAAILSRCGWSVRLDEADLSLALSDLTSSPARSISLNRTILECYEISHGRKNAAAAAAQLCPSLQQHHKQHPQHPSSDARAEAGAVTMMPRSGNVSCTALGFLRRL